MKRDLPWHPRGGRHFRVKPDHSAVDFLHLELVHGFVGRQALPIGLNPQALLPAPIGVLVPRFLLGPFRRQDGGRDGRDGRDGHPDFWLASIHVPPNIVRRNLRHVVVWIVKSWVHSDFRRVASEPIMPAKSPTGKRPLGYTLQAPIQRWTIGF
jgi:hypothetical protein